MAKRWLLVGLAVIGGLVLAGTDWWRSTFAAQPLARPGPRVIVSERHDRSPALRTIPVVVPPATPVRQIPRHSRPTRRANPGARALLADPLIQTFVGSPSMPAADRSFDGVPNISGALPSDANGDVGPQHFFQTVNLSLAIYNKGTATTPPALIYGPFAGQTIWSGFGGPCEIYNSGDPIVMYDHLADRWFISQLALPNVFFGYAFGPFYQCVAVSTSPDPTGSYYRYQFAFDKLNDYPKFGVWTDAYYMAINQFESISLQWAGQGVIAIDRQRMLAGQPASIVYFDLSSVDTNLGGMLPADLDGIAPPAGSPGYYLQVDDDAWGYSPDQLQLWRFHVDWANPASSSFTGPTLLTTAPFDSDLCGYTPCVRQPGTTARLDAISDRLMYRLQYRNFVSHDALIVNHTVDAGQDHAGIRWYEVRDPGSAPVIYQQGTYAPDPDDRTVGSAAMDRVGNLALGFTVTGQTTYPSMRYTGRLADDPLGLLPQGEAELVTGLGSQTHSSGRWGDYSALVLDPSDGCTFWYTSQYYSATSEASWRTRIGSFAFPSCTSAVGLPTVTVTATTPAATEAGLAAGRLTFTRTGDTSAALTVRYTVSGTATPDNDYLALSGAATISAAAFETAVDVTPLDDVIVEANETVVVTLDANEFYSIGAPGGGIVSITSDDSPPDLVVAALTAPAVSGAGASVTVTDTTSNPGAATAAISATGFYLSTNSTFDANDVLLGARPVPSLAAGGTSTGSTTLTIPAATLAGVYYIVAKADASNALVETLENNNTKSASIGIGPDLTVSAVSVPPTGVAGMPIAVSDTTANGGGGAAAGSVTSFYLSANSTFGAGDTLIGSRPVASLAPGAAEPGSISLTIPANTPGGTYYIVARADANGSVAETSETNNNRAGQIRIGADLTVPTLTVPATAANGASIVVTDTTKNDGAGPAGPSHTAFYLSPNSFLDASDTLLGTREVSPLEAGIAESASTTLVIPAGIATGSYYLVAKADVNAAVAEGNEANNNSSGKVIRIGADLIVTAFTAPATAAAGASITVSDTTRNDGAAASAESQTRFYLSSNSTLDAADVSLGTRPVASLAASTSDSGSSVLIIPATTSGGTYYVIAKADGADSVAESVETNNTRASSNMKIGADLTVSLATLAPSGAGMSIVVTDTTRNQGAGAAEPTSTGFYLSSNSAHDAGDLLLGSRPVPSLAPNATSAISTTLQIPASTPTATYYVIAKADLGGGVTETNESNNYAATSIRIGPDLVVSAIAVPSTAVSGTTITVSDTTRNDGGGSATASTTRFYLSTNTAFDAGDTLLGSRPVGVLGAGASSPGSTVVTIPAGLPTATFYLFAVADGDAQLVETKENNNTGAASVRVTAAP